MHDAEILWDASRGGTDAITTLGTHSHVDLNFSCDLVEYDCYHDVILGQNVRPSFMRKWVHIDIEEFMNPEVLCQTIAEGVRDFRILDDHHRGELIRLAFDTATTLFRFMPPHHNVLVIPFHFVAIRRCVVLDVNRARMSPPSMEEADSGMVPATDSSIESLKIKTTTSQENGEICSICLEDFYAGCEASSLPCSHIFHEKCIKKWLKSSHYCPLCRYEMPID